MIIETNKNLFGQLAQLARVFGFYWISISTERHVHCHQQRNRLDNLWLGSNWDIQDGSPNLDIPIPILNQVTDYPNWEQPRTSGLEVNDYRSVSDDHRPHGVSHRHCNVARCSWLSHSDMTLMSHIWRSVLATVLDQVVADDCCLTTAEGSPSGVLICLWSEWFIDHWDYLNLTLCLTQCMLTPDFSLIK